MEFTLDPPFAPKVRGKKASHVVCKFRRPLKHAKTRTWLTSVSIRMRCPGLAELTMSNHWLESTEYLRPRFIEYVDDGSGWDKARVLDESMGRAWACFMWTGFARGLRDVLRGCPVLASAPTQEQTLNFLVWLLLDMMGSRTTSPRRLRSQTVNQTRSWAKHKSMPPRKKD